MFSPIIFSRSPLSPPAGFLDLDITDIVLQITVVESSGPWASYDVEQHAKSLHTRSHPPPPPGRTMKNVFGDSDKCPLALA